MKNMQFLDSCEVSTKHEIKIAGQAPPSDECWVSKSENIQ